MKNIIKKDINFPKKKRKNLILGGRSKKIQITCDNSSGTVIFQTIDLSTGFDRIRYERPFSANLVSKCPKLR